ncbi:hypothetical protein [Dysgonomonas sp. 25]|uniref:hypothetical protein n=1 Tax=Dysgonomonas sp. 25 TaxID=2302933 RepID=UPI0013D0A968|nr:hypothetical protein [Dysgonomonas sp. 25]NDV67531.1 hypothetical protein [Dysgonomonas sp. 25]
MNKVYIIIMCIIISLLGVLYSCSSDKGKYEVRNIYVDANIAYPEIKACFENSYKGMSDTLYNWEKPYTKEGADSIIYNYFDFKELPSGNLLNGTRRYRISLYEKKDSVGNPTFNMEHFIWDVSDWRRIANFGETSFRVDSLISQDELCNILIRELDFRYSKMLP